MTILQVGAPVQCIGNESSECSLLQVFAIFDKHVQHQFEKEALLEGFGFLYLATHLVVFGAQAIILLIQLFEIVSCLLGLFCHVFIFKLVLVNSFILHD